MEFQWRDSHVALIQHGLMYIILVCHLIQDTWHKLYNTIQGYFNPSSCLSAVLVHHHCIIVISTSHWDVMFHLISICFTPLRPWW